MFSNMISYFPGAGAEYIPKIIYHQPFKVLMDEKHSMEYAYKHEKEKIAAAQLPSIGLKYANPKVYNEKMQMVVMARKRIISRNISNFFYNGVDTYMDDNDETITLPDLLTTEGGWVDDNILKNGMLYKHSPKFALLLSNISLGVVTVK